MVALRGAFEPISQRPADLACGSHDQASSFATCLARQPLLKTFHLPAVCSRSRFQDAIYQPGICH